MKTFKIYSPSTFQISNTMSLTAVTFCTSHSRTYYYRPFVPFDHIHPFLHTPSPPHPPPANTNLFSVCDNCLSNGFAEIELTLWSGQCSGIYCSHNVVQLSSPSTSRIQGYANSGHFMSMELYNIYNICGLCFFSIFSITMFLKCWPPSAVAWPTSHTRT